MRDTNHCAMQDEPEPLGPGDRWEKGECGRGKYARGLICAKIKFGANVEGECACQECGAS
jgi:hypothetical protein